MKLIILALAALLVGPVRPVLAPVQTTKDVDITVTHGGTPCTGPTISVDNPTPAAGAPMNVTVACGPGNPKDFVQFSADYNNTGAGPWVYLNGAKSATLQFSAPNAKVDRPIGYFATFFANDSYQQVLANTTFTVPASVSSTTTASLPASVAADPFSPQHVVTICLSGCNFQALGDAISDATAKGWDFVQFKVSAGEYPYPQYNPFYAPAPNNTWVKGISADGHTYPHFFGRTPHGGQLFYSGNYNNAPKSMTIDNIEFGPWDYRVFAGGDDSVPITLRNVYIHDCTEGIITGNNPRPFVINFFNAVIARCGSGNGPEHDVYLGDNVMQANAVNSVFEQPIIGHAFKERAQEFNAKCSIFAVNQDAVYLGSETIDVDSGKVTLTNILSVNGGGSPAGWTNQNSWDNIRWGVDSESDPPAVHTLMATGSTFVADQPGSAHWHITTGLRFSTTPMVWTNNKFIWSDPNAHRPGPGGNNQADATGALYSLHTGDTIDITLDGSNSFSTSGWAGTGHYPMGWRDFLPLMPAACTDPIGLVKIPAS
jgi:hypothetical protein